ncbi:MAG: hypothetical protein HRU09_04130 [Oligoflexales bacterium]|nr:hypothetical protein [Oligoflexales bacterium]
MFPYPSKNRYTLWLLTVSLLACGGGQKPRSDFETYSPAEKAFINAARAYKIPVRFLVAIAHVESNLSPSSATTLYANAPLGPRAGESAFGISRTKLGVPEGQSGDQLELQIEAYSRWVTSQLPQGLSDNIKDDEDKFNWIWSLAALHRENDATSSLFAKEVIEALNEGFHWIDPKSGDVIQFPAEEPAINVTNLRDVSRNHLKILSLTRTSPVDSARVLVLSGQHDYGQKQSPRGIEVIHCPFSFSSCIEMQYYDGKENKDFHLGAHFIIPQKESLSKWPLQLARYDDSVPQMSADGNIDLSTDKVIIMLTGLSGRMVSGIRTPASPSWLTPWQLQRMGELVQDICDMLVIEYEDSENPLSRGECMEVGTGGTGFSYQKMGEPFYWGAISDFDASIFTSYIFKSDQFSGKTVFEYPLKKQIFSKNEPISLNLTFGLRAKNIHFEHLVRCPENNRVLWTTSSREQVRSQVNFLFEKQLHDAGPNYNGTHYIRAKVFGESGELIGWDLATVYLSDYEQTSQGISPYACQGTP